MIRIRTKLLVFLIVLLILLNGVAFLLYQSNQNALGQYNQLLNRFFLLNEVSQKTDRVYELLNTYLSEQTPKAYQKYLQERKTLKKKQAQLSDLANENNHITLENYRHMITSFLEESAIVSGAFQNDNINRYSEHLTETENISQMIHNATLTLLNGELTNYHSLYQQMKQKNAYFHQMGVLVFISTFFLCLLFAYWFSRGITKPIGDLTAGAKEISQGELEGNDVQVATKDEFRFLAHTFNDMRGNIREMVTEVNEKAQQEQLLKEMELKSLQSQINPHFLFNILNTISKTAYLEEAERTSDLIDSTAALLRHNLSRLDQPTTLGREMDVIREYFFLQQARFGERVTFQTTLDDACQAVAMPSMTLQPLVENAFIHGIESYEQGARIDVRTACEAGWVVVTVMDNGVGMDEEIRQDLLSLADDGPDKAASHGHATGLGVKNVIKRLQLFYQRDDLVTIDSELGKGTVVTLRLPFQQGE